MGWRWLTDVVSVLRIRFKTKLWQTKECRKPRKIMKNMLSKHGFFSCCLQYWLVMTVCAKSPVRGEAEKRNRAGASLARSVKHLLKPEKQSHRFCTEKTPFRSAVPLPRRRHIRLLTWSMTPHEWPPANKTWPLKFPLSLKQCAAPFPKQTRHPIRRFHRSGQCSLWWVGGA